MNNEFLKDIRESISDIVGEATVEDREKQEREESVNIACEGIAELLGSHNYYRSGEETQQPTESPIEEKEEIDG